MVGHLDNSTSHTHAHTHTHQHTHTHMHTHTRAHTCIHTCVHTHAYTHARTHMHIHTHAHAHTHTNNHIHTHHSVTPNSSNVIVCGAGWSPDMSQMWHYIHVYTAVSVTGEAGTWCHTWTRREPRGRRLWQRKSKGRKVSDETNVTWWEETCWGKGRVG